MIRPCDGETTDPTPPPPTAAEDSGDSACWAHRVCQQCGRLNDAERPEVCEVCGATFPLDWCPASGQGQAAARHGGSPDDRTEERRRVSQNADPG